MNTDKTNVNRYTGSEVFKIQAIGKKAEKEKYLTINNQDSEALFSQNLNSNIKKLVLGEQDEDNNVDSFKFIIPKDDEYLELSVCIDLRKVIKVYISKLKTNLVFWMTLKELVEAVSQKLIILNEFMQNKLKGKMRAEYKFGEIIPHRQEMIAKVGILKALFKLLDLVLSETPKGGTTLLSDLQRDKDNYGRYENMFEALIETIHTATKNNPTNVAMAIAKIDQIQMFVSVNGCTDLLISLFKDKHFELNKKEIHSEFLYRRVYEIERFKKVAMHFITRVKKKRDSISLTLLRKMCIIDRNPLPHVQELILKELYESNDYEVRFDIKLE